MKGGRQERSKVEAQRSKLKGERGEGGGSVGNGLTLKVLRKHIKRLVNYAEAGDGVKIREEKKNGDRRIMLTSPRENSFWFLGCELNGIGDGYRCICPFAGAIWADFEVST